MISFSSFPACAGIVFVALFTAACSSNPAGPAAPPNLPPPRPFTATPAPIQSAALPPLAQAQTTQATTASPANASQGTSPAPSPVPPARMTLETGLHRCELDQRVTVKKIAPDRSSLLLNWKGKDYTMQAVKTESGALRYEDKAAGLVWMAIVGKSQLLDSKRGQRLANECNL